MPKLATNNTTVEIEVTIFVFICSIKIVSIFIRLANPNIKPVHAYESNNIRSYQIGGKLLGVR